MAFRSSILPSATSRPLAENNSFADLLDVVHQMRSHQHAPLTVSHRRVQRLEHEITCGSVETVRGFVGDDRLWMVNDGASEFGGLPHAVGTHQST